MVWVMTSLHFVASVLLFSHLVSLKLVVSLYEIGEENPFGQKEM